MGGVMLHDVAKTLFFTMFFTDVWYRLGSLRRHQDRSKRAEGSSEKLREAQKSSRTLGGAQVSSGMLRCTHAPMHECMPACPHARTDACTQARKYLQMHARTPATSLKHIRQPLNAQKKHKNTQFQLKKQHNSQFLETHCFVAQETQRLIILDDIKNPWFSL